MISCLVEKCGLKNLSIAIIKLPHNFLKFSETDFFLNFFFKGVLELFNVKYDDFFAFGYYKEIHTRDTTFTPLTDI